MQVVQVWYTCTTKISTQCTLQEIYKGLPRHWSMRALKLEIFGAWKLGNSKALKFSIHKLPSPQAPLQTIYNIGKKTLL